MPLGNWWRRSWTRRRPCPIRVIRRRATAGRAATRNASSTTGDLTVVPHVDDDASLAPRSSPFLQVVLPGRPATFVGDGCLLVVGRKELTFDLVLLGSLVNKNQHAIGQVLAVVVAHAEAISISLGGLDELDESRSRHARHRDEHRDPPQHPMDHRRR